MPPIGALDLTIAWDADRYPEVWQDMLAEVAAALPDVPLICHPVAAPTPAYGIGLPVEATVSILNAIPQITGWKMTHSYEGYRRISRALRGLDRHVGVLGATAVNFHENLASGTFDGTVTGSFNYALEPMLDHLRAWRDGDHACALKIWDDGLAQLHGVRLLGVGAASRPVQDRDLAARDHRDALDAGAHAEAPQRRGRQAP
jgi:4-hydroxy-tetrahydrodipicolinate synthase